MRVHRALSWLGRAEADDLDVKFILLWVAFKAAYASEIDSHLTSEREGFLGFFDVLMALDGGQQIYSTVWKRYPHEIRMLLNNRYIFAPYWAHQNGVPGNENHVERLASSMAVVNKAMAGRNRSKLLSLLFDRLYVLRNQVVHGGTTRNSQVNPDQVRDQAAALFNHLPIFIPVMMHHPTRDWRRLFYPMVHED